MTGYDTMISDLQKVAYAHEEAARHLFVVCGQPDTQEGFEMAWAKEDKLWYDEWNYLHYAINTLERARAKNS